MKLYELTNEYKELMNLDDIPEDALADTLEAIEGEISVKAKNIAFMLENWNADVVALKHHRDAISKRIKVIENRQAALRDYLRSNMERCEIKKIQCQYFDITLCNGRDILVIDDEKKIPSTFVEMKVIHEIDKTGITKKLKEGEQVDGARLEKSKSSIRIK